jgi:pantetheine-phosphate adenylyltransferase
MASIQHKLTTGLFPASFDPITNGHLDIVERALNVCDRVVLAVAVNLAKAGAFSTEERVEMMRQVMANEPRVEVTTFDTLTVDYAPRGGADVIFRGIRAMADFEYVF